MLDRLGDYAIYAEDKIDTIDSLTPVILFDEDFDEDDEDERDDLLDDSAECEPDDNNDDDCDDSDDHQLG